MTTVSVSEAKARLNEFARLAHSQHERFTLTRNGIPEAVLLSVDDLEGLEITLETLADRDSIASITEALGELEAGSDGTSPEELRARLYERRRPTAG